MAALPSNRDTDEYALLLVSLYVYAFQFYSHHIKNSIIALTVR